jgi:hypothetical protein
MKPVRLLLAKAFAHGYLNEAVCAAPFGGRLYSDPYLAQTHGKIIFEMAT